MNHYLALFSVLPRLSLLGIAGKLTFPNHFL
ncbi:hypothetical protein ACVW0P_002921 [Mucilaginibacter sp. UYNi724]